MIRLKTSRPSYSRNFVHFIITKIGNEFFSMFFCALLSSFRANTCHDTILQHTSFHLKRFAGSSFISFLMRLPGLANL